MAAFPSASPLCKQGNSCRPCSQCCGEGSGRGPHHLRPAPALRSCKDGWLHLSSVESNRTHSPKVSLIQHTEHLRRGVISLFCGLMRSKGLTLISCLNSGLPVTWVKAYSRGLKSKLEFLCLGNPQFQYQLNNPKAMASATLVSKRTSLLVSFFLNKARFFRHLRSVFSISRDVPGNAHLSSLFYLYVYHCDFARRCPIATGPSFIVALPSVACSLLTVIFSYPMADMSLGWAVVNRKLMILDLRKIN